MNYCNVAYCPDPSRVVSELHKLVFTFTSGKVVIKRPHQRHLLGVSGKSSSPEYVVNSGAIEIKWPRTSRNILPRDASEFSSFSPAICRSQHRPRASCNSQRNDGEFDRSIRIGHRPSFGFSQIGSHLPRRPRSSGGRACRGCYLSKRLEVAIPTDGRVRLNPPPLPSMPQVAIRAPFNRSTRV